MRPIVKTVMLGTTLLALGEIILPTSPTEATAPTVRTIKQAVHETARKYGIPPLLSEALIDVESNWNPEAMGINVGRDGRVKSRDHGLMQVNDENAKRYGISWLELYENPEVNIELGHAILANCAKRYETEKHKETKYRKTIACYNAGPGNLQAGYPHANKVLERLKQRLFAGL